MRPKRRTLLIGLVLLCGFTGVFTWLIWRERQQIRLNRLLISAVRSNDAPRVIHLLSKGADAKARDVPAQNESPWKILWDRVCGKKAIAPTQYPTALMVMWLPDSELLDPAGHANREQAGKITACLLAHGANPNDRYLDGSPVLLPPCLYHYPNCVEALLQKGADANAAGSGGKTGLYFAVHEGDAEVVQLLLAAGAKVDERAMRMAQARNLPEMRSLPHRDWSRWGFRPAPAQVEEMLLRAQTKEKRP